VVKNYDFPSVSSLSQTNSKMKKSTKKNIQGLFVRALQEEYDIEKSSESGHNRAQGKKQNNLTPLAKRAQERMKQPLIEHLQEIGQLPKK